MDGRPYVTGIAVTSTPPNGTHYRIGDEKEITATFDHDLSAGPPLAIPLTIGDGFSAGTWVASYSSDSQGNKLVFSHRVGKGQRDDDGISIAAGRRILDIGRLCADGSTVAANRDIPGLPDQAGHKVYGFLPVVRSSDITSSPAMGDTYRKGETVELSLTFNYEVEISETPTIRVLVGETDNQRSATYSSGAGTDTLLFGYEVQATDLDADGLALMARISGGFEGGNVNEAGTNNRSEGRIAGFDSMGSHKVDGRPYVTATSITSTPANDTTYSPGETIEVTLAFDRVVNVEEKPSIKLVIGDNEKEAEYQIGSGANALVFEYDVQDGDLDSDGLTITEDGLALNDGGIEDDDEVAANLGYTEVSLEGQLVDGVAPTFVNAATSSDGKQVTITFSEDVDVSDNMRTLSGFAGVDVAVYLQVLMDVFADGHRMHAVNAEISGAKLDLYMDTAITEGQEVTVSYDNLFKDSLPAILLDGAGNSLDSFSAQPVTNNSGVAEYTDALWPVLSSHGLIIPEGGSGSYTVALDSEPEEDATVTLSINPSGRLTASPSELTFTTENWATPQAVTLNGVEDSDSHDSWHEIIHSSGVNGFVVGHIKVLIESNR